MEVEVRNGVLQKVTVFQEQSQQEKPLRSGGEVRPQAADRNLHSLLRNGNYLRERKRQRYGLTIELQKVCSRLTVVEGYLKIKIHDTELVNAAKNKFKFTFLFAKT